MDKSYYKYWGKARKEGDKDGEPYHLLAYHSLDVAAVGQVLLNQNHSLLQHLSQLSGLEEKQFKQWAIFFLALHDIGKFSDSFQNIIPELLKQLQHRSSDRNYAIRHDSLGFLLWRRELKRVFVTLGIMPVFSKRRKSKQQQVQVITHWMSAVTGMFPTPVGMNRLYLVQQTSKVDVPYARRDELGVGAGLRCNRLCSLCP